MTHLISHEPIAENDQLAEITTYQGALSLRIHARGFLEIAQVACNAALANLTSIDSNCPSIIYAIRHATELYLKHIIVDINEIHKMTAGKPEEDGKVLQKSIASHKILKMWNEHSPMIRDVLDYESSHGEHSGFDCSVWFNDFEMIIKQLHEIDPEGSSLRYPTSTSGQPNLDGKMIVSISQLKHFASHTMECFDQFENRLC